MDQCTHCTVKGNIGRCLETTCSIHESWLVKEIQKKDKWISVKDRLPFQEEKYKDWPGVCDQFLVTVDVNVPDPNVDPEVMLLWFDNKSNRFSYELGAESYDEENEDWHVVAWKEKPIPFKMKKDNING